MTPESHTAEIEKKTSRSGLVKLLPGCFSLSDRRRISNAGILRRLLRRRKNDARKTA